MITIIQRMKPCGNIDFPHCSKSRHVLYTQRRGTVPRPSLVSHHVNSTPHRARFAHAIFSGVRLRFESQTQCEANSASVQRICHSRAPCLTLTRHGLIFHLFHFLNASPLYFYHLTTRRLHSSWRACAFWRMDAAKTACTQLPSLAGRRWSNRQRCWMWVPAQRLCRRLRLLRKAWFDQEFVARKDIVTSMKSRVRSHSWVACGVRSVVPKKRCQLWCSLRGR